MICPACDHDEMLHDGDGAEHDPFICRAAGCQCAYFIEFGDPVAVVLEDRG